jgi:hypothetical protein
VLFNYIPESRYGPPGFPFCPLGAVGQTATPWHGGKDFATMHLCLLIRLPVVE